ncbi:LuxR C-terminal-related transcriptional regulator [Dyadobacter diqingensis]|uniref:LuxR C-terminal-related transcriptional regulator n=1 Tax=Dyadobacter diqingensis TaxID=2938121 RepID=UPI0020C2E997|nr:response regulator transcription factor [Dyadobacter diqingensis]
MYKVLIIEDHEVVARSVAMIVEDLFSGSVVSLVSTFGQGTDLLQPAYKFDLIILDIDIPGGEFYGMIGSLRALQPDVRILVFTGQLEEKHALGFLSAGANGFLSKNSPMNQIGIAIRQVLNDKKYMTEQVQQQVADSFFNKVLGKTHTEPATLSPREMEVLDLLMQGKWVKEIALELNLKLTTVSTHKTRIFEKMQVSNIIELYKKVQVSKGV